MEFPHRLVEEIFGIRPAAVTALFGGYTSAGKWRVELAGGARVFVKAARAPDAAAVRREAAMLAELDGSFHPNLIGSGEGDETVVVVLEDLTDAEWPPPFPYDVAPAFDALDEIAAHPVPAHLPVLKPPASRNWPSIARDPGSLVDLGVCPPGWLGPVVPLLAFAEAEFDPTGKDLVHNDIWAGNLAFQGRRCVFTDWSEARRGAAWIDRGFLTLSLRSERGPVPTRGFDHDAEFVGWWSGELARQVLDGPRPGFDPSIIDGLRQDLAAALVWAAELFDLPSPAE